MSNLIGILSFLILFLIIFMIYFTLFHGKDIISSKKYYLEKDGLIVMKNIFKKGEISEWKNLCLKEKYKELKQKILSNRRLDKIIKREIGEDYIFQDYILVIKKSAVHTCHRDYNGDFFNDTQKQKSYTMLIYLEDMPKCLGVVPTSHKDMNSFQFNLSDPVKHVVCKKGDIILFDANLIHVGSLNDKKDNLRIQLKITNKEDLEALSYYQNYHKVLNEENNLPWFITHSQQKMSCMIPGLADLTQKENIQSVKKEKNSLVQQWFSYLFYGNKNFYQLKNVF